MTSNVSSAGMLRPPPLEDLGSEILDHSELSLDQAEDNNECISAAQNDVLISATHRDQCVLALHRNDAFQLDSSILNCNASCLRDDLDDSEELGALEMSDDTFLVGCEPLSTAQLANGMINIKPDELITSFGASQLRKDLDSEIHCEDLIADAHTTGALLAILHEKQRVGIAPVSSIGFSVKEPTSG